MTNWKQVYSTSAPGMKRAAVWVIGNAVFGGLPFLIIWFLPMIVADNNEVVMLKQKQLDIFRDCAVLFLCCAITGAAMLDFGLSQTKPPSNQVSLGIIAPAFIVILLAVVLYVNAVKAHPTIEIINGKKYIELSSDHKSSINMNSYGTIHTVLIVFTIIYSLTVKTYIYTKEATNEYN